jgi:predicted dehydrogenase
VSAVFDEDASRATNFAEWRSCDAVGSVEEVLDRCDAVFVCSWTSAHREAVAAAVARGKSVFCEKPLATDLDGAVEMCDLVEAAGVVNEVGLVLRSSPAFLALRELIRDDASGPIMSVVFRDDQYIPTQGMYNSTWRGDRSKAGSGALLEHSIHDVDILEWLCGPVATVSAHMANHHGLDGIEDSVAAMFRFEDGHTATLTSVWHDILSRPSLRRLEVFCERAFFVLEGDHDGPLRWERAADTDSNHAGSSEHAGDSGALAGDALIEWLTARGVLIEPAENAFLRAVRERGLASPSFRDAVRAHRLVDAAYRSAAAGGAPVAIDA